MSPLEQLRRLREQVGSPAQGRAEAAARAMPDAAAQAAGRFADLLPLAIEYGGLLLPLLRRLRRPAEGTAPERRRAARGPAARMRPFVRVAVVIGVAYAAYRLAGRLGMSVDLQVSRRPRPEGA